MRSMSIRDVESSYHIGTKHDDRWLVWWIGLFLACAVGGLALLGYVSGRSGTSDSPDGRAPAASSQEATPAS